MYLIREIMYCKPGKVRALLDKFKTMQSMGERAGMPKMRVMTDVSADRYWTLVSEMEVESLDKFLSSMGTPQPGQSADDMKKMQEVMKDYHDLVDFGRREIYKIEM